ncbi:aminotransferase class I/II-fold pyridoxal phosphate-dependent enzyme [Patulibacter sp. SYSU D01012]|uniref:pyridoxal phosphate-dependent aminotransferase n=1 Tax=Patulibacter sp. SYSU D01012 TaxID=2817381 RepID=UPI001B311F17|nr:aminotransferase class I/II-fold pyridoxal phosphate-dependent enzyme [Patulibacter sp. SYSU D01012]
MPPAFARNPVLARTGSYPFQRLSDARTVVAARPDAPRLLDFGTGEPREPTPAFIREALVAAVQEETVSAYPLAAGLPELRRAVADWIARRFGVAVHADRHVLPTLGSKELVFSLPQVLVDREGGRDLVGVPQPAYPVYERGARYAGADVLDLPLVEERGFLPDLDAIPAEAWARLALLWTNYPNNPTAAVADRGWYREAAAACREHGVVLASDEAYSELWFRGEAPDSALQIGESGDELTGVLVVNTLSKRSSMPGYRSGFVAGDADLIAALRRFRPSVGVAPQRFVQHAAVAAWGDEDHVAAVREVYREKLRVLQPGLDALGLQTAGGDASFFRWLRLPADWAAARWAAAALDDAGTAQLVALLTDGDAADRGSAAFAACLLHAGVVAAPGAFFGPAGEGYVRMALVPTLEDCRAAAERLAALAAA